MVQNASGQKQVSIYNMHNISWFPSILLLFQLVLLLIELFEVNSEIVMGFKQFLQESSLFLSIINGLLIIWYWKKSTILKRSDVSKEYKIINSCICVANIVLLNKLYNNNKIYSAFSMVKSFLVGDNTAKYALALVVIAIFLVVHYTIKASKNTPPCEMQHDNSTNKERLIVSAVQEKPKVNNVGVNALFITIFMVLLLAILAVVYILIAKYDMVSNIINDTEEGTSFLTYFLIFISAMMLIISSIIIMAAIARSFSKFLFQIPEYIRRSEVQDDRIIKITIGIVLIPIFYGITKLFGISTDWVLNLLQNQDFLVVPFIILIYFILSILFVEILYGLFSGKPRTKWLNSFAEIITNTGDSVVKICDSIVKSFFRLLMFIPDFLESIQIVLMGEDEEFTKR